MSDDGPGNGRKPPEPSTPSQETAPLAEEALRAAIGRSEKPWALLVGYQGGTDALHLDAAQRIVIGREAPSDVLIPDPRLSREHALFTATETGVTVEDLGSRNGTWFKGERVVARCAILPGERVVLGGVLVSLFRTSRAGPPAGDGTSFTGRAMREVVDQIEGLSRSTIPVLIQGETGVGKEILAGAIHEGGLRRAQRMVCLNCGAIPEQLVESELFGHERGAFSGADQQKKGAFEVADGGTLFLDEVGEASPTLQTKLLRVLGANRVTRVGSTREIPVSVRVIWATNRDLEAMCQEGSFRRDLLYRLNTMTLLVPPLRERTDEIATLVEGFLSSASAAHGVPIRSVSHEAMTLLEAYAWPGNVRELRNVIERAVVVARGDEITAEALPDCVRGARSSAGARRERGREGNAAGSAVALKAQLVALERDAIVAALDAAGGNQTEAAKQMGMPLRTFVRKIGLLGLRKKP